MAHGYPDWAQSAGVNTVYQLRDLAELAARLGSIDTFDRRGDVFHLQDFEHGDGSIDNDTSGDDAACGLSLVTSRSGSFSYRLKTGTDSDCYAEVDVYSVLPSLSCIGAEISFAQLHDRGGFILALEIYTGEHIITPKIKYDYLTQKLYYWSDVLTWVEIGSVIRLPNSTKIFNTVKLVIDCANMKYKRAILGVNGYALADVDCRYTASIIAASIGLKFRHYGDTLTSKNSYADDVIFTQNEP